MIPYPPRMTSSTEPGQSRIRAAFEHAKAQQRCAVLPFVTAGYPTLDATARLLRELPAAGADLIEIGFPFSDPIADGPIIAESMHHALQGGTTPDQIFELVRRVQPIVPVIAMVSISIVGRMGIEAFLRRACEAGFSGFIVPDADPATAREIAALTQTLNAGFCPLVAPTTTSTRLSELAALSTGFIYLLARAGVTGERTDAPDIALRVKALRAVSSSPIAAGFGIATAAHVRAVGEHADGAIVGSAIVRTMRDALATGSDAVTAAIDLVSSYRPASQLTQL